MFKYKPGQLLLRSDAIYFPQLFLVIAVLKFGLERDNTFEVVIINQKTNFESILSFDCNIVTSWEIVQDT
mgnify:CR=1 FL=1